MAAKSTSRKVVSSLTFDELAQSWYRSMEAADRAVNTLKSHKQGIEKFRQYLEDIGASQRIAEITRRQVEDYLIELRRQYVPNTVRLRFLTLSVFFNWCVAEEEIDFSPMARLPRPKVDEPPPAMLSTDEVTALLKTCTGKAFNDRRDRAIFLLLIDTGMRLHEIRQLTLDVIDQKARTFTIVGKGRRARTGHFEVVAAAALDTYLRARSRYINEHPHLKDERALWLGKRGPLSNMGIYQLVVRRAKQAGITGVHPHQFRHGFAHDCLSAGMSEGDLMRLAGWSPGSRMVYRYGAAQAEERAREAHKKYSPANRLLQPRER